MLWVEAVTERMTDHVVGHHPTMPSAGKTAHALNNDDRPVSLQGDGRGEFSRGCAIRAIRRRRCVAVSKALMNSSVPSGRPVWVRVSAASPPGIESE
jgi:hypothetical protein